MENVLATVREFLSTFSLRRATLELKPISNFGLISIHALLAESDILDVFRVIHRKDFYPRSPCGERPSGQIFGPAVCIIISIHALLAESDLVIAIQSVPVFSFLSTLSLRRATFVFSRMGVGLLAFLSTLSLRRATGGQSCNSTLVQSFYPRSPCGERRVTSSTVIVILRVSIHALLAESDRHWQMGHSLARHFYPRSPCGERPQSP